MNKLLLSTLFVATASFGLSACGGSDSDGGGNGSISTKYPWTIIEGNEDSSGTAVLQKIERRIVDGVMYLRPPTRIAGGNATANYYDIYYGNPDFFTTLPSGNTKYGEPVALITSSSDTKVVSSPYNNEMKKYITETAEYKIINLSGKSVYSANDNILSGFRQLASERFPTGAKCRAIAQFGSKVNVGDIGVYLQFDESEEYKTNYSNFDQWKNALGVAVADEVMGTIDEGDKNIPFMIVTGTDGLDYIGVKYANHIYNADAYADGVYPTPELADSCYDYNDVATQFITKLGSENFYSRPIAPMDKLAPNRLTASNK